MAPRLVILGWDSATFEILDELVEAGRLPHLAGLLERGFRAPLHSTWPPMTDSAWTSAFTGRNPGGHGIFGSWYRAPGSYGCRYFSSRDRRAPALWELAPGTRFLVWNVPMTYPPAPVEGVMVAGYAAPPGSRFCAPEGFQDELGRRWPLPDLLDRAPHGSLERFLDELVRGLEAQAEALPWAATHAGADAVVAVWPHVDRAQHFLWRFRGTDHPLADGIERVHAAIDRATGAVMEAFPEADVVIVSDHGAGPLHADVNLGAWLAGSGYAAYAPDRASPVVKLAWALPPPLRRLGKRLAPGTARRVFGATLAGQIGRFDWPHTRAFLGIQGDVWLNLRGREAAGTVAPEDAGDLAEELRAGLLALEDPRTGERLFAAAHRRDEVYSGPSAGLAPDLMLDAWSRGYRVAPRRSEGDLVVPPSPL
ncbi:MAG: alkaline phosphatase family protein, partial [Actinomycetota bacterium]